MTAKVTKGLIDHCASPVGSGVLQDWDGFLWFLLGISVCAQPTDLRLPGGVPVSLSVLAVLVIIALFKWIRRGGAGAYTRFEILMIYVTAFGFVLNEAVNSSYERGAIYFFCLASFVVFENVSISERSGRALFGGLFYGATILLVIGWMRYLFGYAPSSVGSQNEYGILDPVAEVMKGLYWGISYGESTRNNEVNYPLFLGLLALNRLVGARVLVERLFLWALFFASSGAVVLSLSRGAWIAYFFSVIVMLRFSLGLGVFFILSCVLVLVASLLAIAYWYLGDVLTYLYASFVSVLDATAASDVTGITYSNADRMSIWSAAIARIVIQPFGQGIDSMPPYSGLGYTSIHSENLYLDYLLIFGWLGVYWVWRIYLSPLFMLLNCVAAKKKADDYMVLNSALIISIVLMAMFNSENNFVLYWMLLPHVNWCAIRSCPERGGCF